MKLYVVFETGPSGKRAQRVFLEQHKALEFLRVKNQHLWRLEEHNSPAGHTGAAEIFAAHAFDVGYNIHRFSGLYRSYDDAREKAGSDGLVVMLVPE